MADHVQSVLRAFDVLQVLAAHEDPVPLAVLAEQTGLAKSTVSRLLATLESISAVGRGAMAGTYTSGPALAGLVGAAPSTSHLLGVARPYLDDLVERFGEDAALAVPDGMDVIYADQAHSPNPIQVPDWTRQRFAPHTVAAGFVVMAWWPAAKLDAYLASGPSPSTAATLTDPGAIRRRLADIRRDGYVWTSDEWIEGITAVAAAVVTADGRLLAALNVFGPSFRFPGAEDRAAVGRELRGLAGRLSRTLQGVPAR